MTSTLDLDAIIADLGPRRGAAAARHDADDSFVAEAYADLRDARAFSALVPTEFGGGGCSHAEMCSFLRRLAQHCPSTALALSMHQHLVAAAVANHRAGRPGRALLERVGASELALVSTGANDWLESNGAAERVAGGWRVTARKPFASGAPAGDLLVTSVAHDTAQEGPQVLHFAVPFDAEGLSLNDDWQAMGMRGTGSCSVTLEAVFVPDEAVVLSRPRGPFHPAFAVILTVALPLILSAYLGTAEAAAEIAREAAKPRADEDAVAGLVGEMETRLAAARLAVEDGIRLANGLDFAPSPEIASAALTRKALAAEAVLAAGELALDVAGGAGFLRRTGLERLVRDLHGARFHPLPAARQRLFTGRLALGADPVAVRPSAQRHAA